MVERHSLRTIIKFDRHTEYEGSGRNPTTYDAKAINVSYKLDNEDYSVKVLGYAWVRKGTRVNKREDLESLLLQLDALSEDMSIIEENLTEEEKEIYHEAIKDGTN